MSEKKTIYCAGAIRGDPTYAENYSKIIRICEKYAIVKTEKSEKYASTIQDFDDTTKGRYKKDIYDRDIGWLESSDGVVAECSGASTGVGYEISYAENVLEIPILCLMYKDSKPSLMIEQNTSDYIIPIKYANEENLNTFIYLFIRLLEKYFNMNNFRLKYFSILKEIDYSYNLYKIDEIIETYISTDQVRLMDLNLIINDDFKNSSVLYEFYFKTIILQKRWSNLSTQRIGKFFISGRKVNIIKLLNQIEMGNISNIHENIDRKKLNYNKFAFNKNLRAYRSIGLLETPTEIKFGGNKIKNNITLHHTLNNKLSIESNYGRRKIMNDFIKITSYLRNLNNFINSYGVELLREFLSEAINSKWFETMNEYNNTYIDDFTIEKLDYHNNIIEINELIKKYIDLAYKNYYSSYYKR